MGKFTFYTHLHNLTGRHFWTGGLVDAERSMDDLLLRLTEQLAKSNMRPTHWLPEEDLGAAWFLYAFGPLVGIGRVSRNPNPPTVRTTGHLASSVYTKIARHGREVAE